MICTFITGILFPCVGPQRDWLFYSGLTLGAVGAFYPSQYIDPAFGKDTPTCSSAMGAGSHGALAEETQSY